MKTGTGAKIAMIAGWLCLGTLAATADTLYLRDGRRIEGRVIAVRSGVVEFEEDRGFSTRTHRIDRADVRRIDFDEDTYEDDTRGGGRPSGLRERTVSVSASTPWSDAGVMVRAGQSVYFSSEGQVRWGPNRRDDAGGESGSPANNGRPIPRRPAAALIGKIGENSTDYFFIGKEEAPIRMRASGRLFLGINDDFLQDNSGAFRVTIAY